MTGQKDQNHQDQPGFSRQDDVAWMAFCYISDELPDDVRIEFEERLAHDQAAREAVSDAVQQAQVLYSTLNSTSFNGGREPVALPARRSAKHAKILRRTRILVASAAALLLIVTGWAWLGSSGSTDGLAENESERLASAWVATLVVMSDDELDDFIDEELPVGDSVAGNSGDEDSGDWMLVALAEMDDTEGVDRESN